MEDMQEGDYPQNKKKSVVDRINEIQMRMEWDFASRELRGYTDKEIHGIY